MYYIYIERYRMSIEYDIYVPTPIVNSDYPSPYFFFNLFSFYINKIFTIQLKPYQSIIWTSLVAQMVKHLLTMQETWVRPLGREDPLEKKMATHSRTIPWKIPWTEEPGRLQSMGSQRVRHD